MYCDQCGGRIEEGTKFCDQCGNRVAGEFEQRLSTSPVRQPAIQGPEIQPAAPVSPMYGVPKSPHSSPAAIKDPPKASPGNASLTDVISNWGPTWFEGLQYSPKQFYASVEVALEKREIPGLMISRVDWHEGGSFSAKREYLRVQRKGLTFDICGAPFGNGFFVSWWLAEVQPSMKGPAAVLAIFPTILYLWSLIAGTGNNLTQSFIYRFIFGTPIVFLTSQFVCFAFLTILKKLIGESIFEVPVVGPLLAYVFKRPTYYKADTTAVYRAAVNAAVQEAVDVMTNATGLRALSPEERKPVMRDLLAG